MAATDSWWSIVSRRTLACQYGSREEFAIMLARQSNPIDTSSPDAVSRPLWHATQRSDVWNCGDRCSERPRKTIAPTRGDECQRQHAPDHRHPSRNPPSNQSHST